MQVYTPKVNVNETSLVLKNDRMTTKRELITELQKSIRLWEGFKPSPAGAKGIPGLEPIEAAFPNRVLPKGVIHEFLCTVSENAAACDGFLSGLLSVLMDGGGACLWINRSRQTFPVSLTMFDVAPERIIFMDLTKERDVLWVMEEALKCKGLAAVIAELDGLSMTESRRLQLAAEESQVTGFVLRTNARNINTTACVARWQVIPLPSETEDDLPGVGFPRWQVDLLRVRNGKPGSWIMEWSADRFTAIPMEDHTGHQRHTGVEVPLRKIG